MEDDGVSVAKLGIVSVEYISNKIILSQEMKGIMYITWG